MKIDIRAFKGRTPRLTDNLLTANDARQAVNCFVGKGDLRAWYQSEAVETRTETSAQSLYKYYNSNDGTTYLVDADDVDYVESPLDNDTYERLYYSGKSEPRVHANDIDLADTLGSELVVNGTNESTDYCRFEEINNTNCTLASSGAQAHAGAASCLMTCSVAGPADMTYEFLDTDLTRVRADYQVTVDLWVYLPSGQACTTVLVQSSDDGGTTWTTEETVTDTDQWVQATFTFTPDTGFGVRVVGENATNVAPDLVYIDDVSIKQNALKYYILGITQPVTTKPATNISVAAGGTAEDRIYAYTYVSSYGEESAPSVISDLVAGVTDTDTVEVSKIEAIPKNRQLDTLRLYRTATGNTNVSEFYRAKDFTLPTITGTWASGSSLAYDGEYWEYDDGTDNLVYKCINNGTTADPDDATNGVGGAGVDHWEYYTVTDDVATATMLSESTVCPSEHYYPPPSGLTNLVRLPNGMMAGFVGNTMYFSENYLPHAWPDETLSLGWDAVGLGVFESYLVVATKLKPSMIVGDNPQTMTEIPLSGKLPCVAKRSMCSGENAVYYASNGGLVEVNESGAHLIRDPATGQTPFTEKEWQNDVIPANLHASFYGNKYFGFNSTSGESFVYDFNTYSYMTLSDIVYASHVANDDGTLYLIEIDGATMYVKEWEGDPVNLKYLTWMSKEFIHGLVNWVVARVRIDPDFYADFLEYLEENSTLETLNAAMVAALSMGGAMTDDSLTEIPMSGCGLYSLNGLSISDTITFQLWVDGAKKFEKQISNNKPFKLPGKYKCRRTKIAISGYLPVDAIEVATGMEEMQ